MSLALGIKLETFMTHTQARRVGIEAFHFLLGSNASLAFIPAKGFYGVGG